MPVDDRYSRQVRFAPIGEPGQRKISGARVGIVGLGALGTVVADQLVRAGVGELHIIDRDYVEVSNLQRQTLYDEEDAKRSLPKAVAAERKLRRINSDVRIEAIVDDLNGENVEDWIEDLDLVLDGLDNFETRYVLNDACRKSGTPWIYTAAVGSYGLVMPVLPEGACMRCVVGILPPAGSSPTCDSAGVISPVTNAIASLQMACALRFLVGALGTEDVRLVSLDVWTLRFQSVAVPATLRSRCPLCSGGRYEYLESHPLRTVTLCGRNAVQLIPKSRGDLDLAVISRNMEVYGRVESNGFLIRCTDPPYELTLFQDGRAIIKGTEEASVAKSVYSRMVGV